MAEALVIAAEPEAGVALGEKHPEATEDTCVRVPHATRGEQEDDNFFVTQPLLRPEHRDAVCAEGPGAGTRTASADGADRRTSVPREPELAARDEPGRRASVGSVCSDSGRHECPICSELFDTHGDRRVTLLHCDHALCHTCAAGIMRRAGDRGRLRCPFCRQTTPFPQWEIRRLQEESYGDGGGDGVFYDSSPAFVVGPGPEPQAVPEAPALCCFAVDAQRSECCLDPYRLVEGLGLTGPRSLCVSATATLLLFLLLLGVFLYMAVPLIMLSLLFTRS